MFFFRFWSFFRFLRGGPWEQAISRKFVVSGLYKGKKEGKDLGRGSFGGFGLFLAYITGKRKGKILEEALLGGFRGPYKVLLGLIRPLGAL